jgi:AcrR family transcriptional regulator
MEATLFPRKEVDTRQIGPRADCLSVALLVIAGRKETELPVRPRRADAWKDAGQSRDDQFAAKRAALIRKAARAFSARGFYNTSLDDIAAELGVTKPALYYYVKNKEEILYACHLIASELGAQAMTFAESLPGSGLDRVVSLARRYVELLTGEFGASAVLTEFDALQPGNRKTIVAARDRFDRRFRALIAKGVEDGSIRQVDPKLTVFFFMGSVNWMTHWFRPDGAYSGQEMADRFADYLRESIRARSART